MTGDRSNCGELKTDSDSLHLTEDLEPGLSLNGVPGPVGRVSGAAPDLCFYEISDRM